MRLDYIVQNNEPVICLTGQGKIKKIRGFEPYFYILKRERKIAEGLNLTVSDNGYISIDGEDLIKITCKLPSDVPKYRQYFSKTYEADVLFPYRYAIDNNLQLSKKVYILYMDVEINATTGFDLQNYSQEVVCISTFFSKNHALITFAFDKKFGRRKEVRQVSDNHYIYYYDNEREMLYAFIRYIRAVKPDILCGYNISTGVYVSDSYSDIRYLIGRMRALNLPYNQLSPLNSVRFDPLEPDIKGIVIIDLLTLISKTHKLKSYSLSHVARIFNLNRKEIDYSKMFEKLDETIDGCENHTFLLYQINLELPNNIEFYTHLATLSKLAGIHINDLFYTNKIADFLLLKYAKEIGYCLPTKRKEPSKKVKYSQKESFVLDPETGTHENVAVFDFASTYPSLVVAFNIGADSVAGLGDENTYKLPNGMRFRKSPPSLTSLIIQDLQFERNRIKEKMKEYLRTHKTTGKEYKIMQATSDYLKGVINALAYGVLRYKNFRLYNEEVGATIPFLAQYFLKSCIEAVKKHGYEVIYADTDSMFVKIRDKSDIDKILSIANSELERKVREMGATQKPNLELDKVFSKIYLSTKKRYAGYVICRKGVWLENEELEVVGLQAVRRDTSEIAVSFQKELIDDLLNNDGKSVENIITKYKNKIKNPSTSPLLYGVPKVYRGNYKTNTMQERAVKMAKRLLGKTIHSGSRFWVLPIGSTDVIAVENEEEAEKIRKHINFERVFETNIYQKLNSFFNKNSSFTSNSSLNSGFAGRTGGVKYDIMEW